MRHDPRIHRACGGGVCYAGPSEVDSRPRFRCSKCGQEWSSGFSGGEWSALVPKDEQDCKRVVQREQ